MSIELNEEERKLYNTAVNAMREFCKKMGGFGCYKCPFSTENEYEDEKGKVVARKYPCDLKLNIESLRHYKRVPREWDEKVIIEEKNAVRNGNVPIMYRPLGLKDLLNK